VLREVLDCTEKGYALEDRKKLAFFYARLANLFVKQEFLVIVATVSMFEDVRKWNRLAIWSLLYINHFTNKKEFPNL